MAKEQFFHPESAELLKTLDEEARRSGLKTSGKEVREALRFDDEAP